MTERESKSKSYLHHLSFDPEKHQAILNELENRCKNANIKIARKKDYEGSFYPSVGMPCGRKTRWVDISMPFELERFLSLKFEDYVFLGDYSAVCNYKKGIIECALVPCGFEFLPSMYDKEIFWDDEDQGVDLRDIGLRKSQQDTMEMRIIWFSQLLDKLCPGELEGGEYYAMRIQGIEFSTHEEALSLLEKISSSVLFQAEEATGVALEVLRKPSAKAWRVTPNFRKFRSCLQFPKYQYDQVPLSLYWYGRGASRMPLLEYLAYYQVIEYYFPVYSLEQACRKIEIIIKNPSFGVDRDMDKIRNIIRTEKSSGLENEQSQLKATINACIMDESDLRELISGLHQKGDSPLTMKTSLSQQQLSLHENAPAVQEQVAARIYDIRCKIVHTKKGGKEGEAELLLPYSKEAGLLYDDIILIRFVAQRVLIAASRPLELIEGMNR